MNATTVLFGIGGRLFRCGVKRCLHEIAHSVIGQDGGLTEASPPFPLLPSYAAGAQST